jgi:hypothetical protein
MTETIHRLLDEAFAGIDMTPEAQDLKEEVRANLTARVAELEAAGESAGDAASRAIVELGDVSELLSGPAATGSAAARLRNRVRPKPAYVVRVVIASALAVAALKLVGFAAAGVLPFPIGVVIALLGFGATAVGWIVGDSLVQETTANHPMPSKRAGGYYLASSLMVFALGSGILTALGTLPMWFLVVTASTLVASIALFSFLVATQTNRHKAWLVALQHDHSQVGTRFEDEPETAARFGIYTLVIWIVAFAAFLVLSFTVGWAWSWLALLGGLAVMMLTLAQMLFGARKA